MAGSDILSLQQKYQGILQKEREATTRNVALKEDLAKLRLRVASSSIEVNTQRLNKLKREYEDFVLSEYLVRTSSFATTTPSESFTNTSLTAAFPLMTTVATRQPDSINTLSQQGQLHHPQMLPTLPASSQLCKTSHSRPPVHPSHSHYKNPPTTAQPHSTFSRLSTSTMSSTASYTVRSQSLPSSASQSILLTNPSFSTLFSAPVTSQYSTPETHSSTSASLAHSTLSTQSSSASPQPEGTSTHIYLSTSSLPIYSQPTLNLHSVTSSTSAHKDEEAHRKEDVARKKVSMEQEKEDGNRDVIKHELDMSSYHHRDRGAVAEFSSSPQLNFSLMVSRPLMNSTESSHQGEEPDNVPTHEDVKQDMVLGSNQVAICNSQSRSPSPLTESLLSSSAIDCLEELPIAEMLAAEDTHQHFEKPNCSLHQSGSPLMSDLSPDTEADNSGGVLDVNTQFVLSSSLPLNDTSNSTMHHQVPPPSSDLSLSDSTLPVALSSSVSEKSNTESKRKSKLEEEAKRDDGPDEGEKDGDSELRVSADQEQMPTSQEQILVNGFDNSDVLDDVSAPNTSQLSPHNMSRSSSSSSSHQSAYLKLVGKLSSKVASLSSSLSSEESDLEKNLLEMVETSGKGERKNSDPHIDLSTTADSVDSGPERDSDKIVSTKAKTSIVFTKEQKAKTSVAEEIKGSGSGRGRIIDDLNIRRRMGLVSSDDDSDLSYAEAVFPGVTSAHGQREEEEDDDDDDEFGFFD